MKTDEREIAWRLYTPPASALLKDLTNLGDGLAGQFATLQPSPTAPALSGALRVVMRIRQGLLAEEDPANVRD